MGDAKTWRQNAFPPTDSHDLLQYKFFESSGTQFTNTGVTSDSKLTLTKFTGTSRIGTPGIYDYSCDLNGSTLWQSTQDLSTVTSINLQVLTVSFWVMVRTFDNAFRGLVNKAYFANGTWANPFHAWSLAYVSSSGDWRSSLAVAGPSINVLNSGAVARLVQNRWHHIGFTFNNTTGTWKLYRDGLLVASTTNIFTIDYGTGGPINVGGDSVGGETANCIIDEVRVANLERPAIWFGNMYNVGKRVQGRPAR